MNKIPLKQKPFDYMLQRDYFYDIIDCDVTDISAIAGCTDCQSLTNINLYGTQVSDISCLASLPHIENIGR